MRLFFVALLLLPALGAPGCASGGRPERLAALPEGPVVVLGDWDDVEAAVRAALTRHELAFGRRVRSPERNSVVYIIHGLRDERGELTLEYDGDPGSGPVEITVSCRLDPATGEARARAVERDVAHRLRQLRGDVARPISW